MSVIKSNIVDVSDLLGKTIYSISGVKSSHSMIFKCTDGSQYMMFHEQECCEDVYIEDICGNISNLIGSPICMAEESSNSDSPLDHDDDSFTWTFYKFATAKGYVTIRWYGCSNGYYSEAVTLERIYTDELHCDLI